MLYEISRRLIVNNIDKINLSWEDSIITVSIHKNLHMLELSTNFHSWKNKTDFNESVIACSTNSPLPENFLDEYVSNRFSYSELVQMMTDPALWPHNQQITNELTDIVQFDWLPQVLQSGRVLSILNRVGNIELYVEKKSKYDCILNVSELMNKYLHNHYNNYNNEEEREFLNMKQFAYNVEPSAMCWSPNTNSDNSCYFVTAMRSGRIILWLLKLDTEFSVQYCGGIEPEGNVIIPKVAWMPLQDTFLLLTCDELGQIVGHKCSIENNTLKNNLTKEIWPQIDKMVPKSFHYYLHDNKIIVMYTKCRLLIVQMFDEDLKLLSQQIELVNGFKIVCITENNNVFYLCTDNVKMYTIDICIEAQNLNVKLNEIIIKDIYPKHELCSLAISTNRAMYALALVDHKVQHNQLELKVVLMCSQTEFDKHISSILNNSTKSLTKVWDLIEVLRLETFKEKQLPEINYKSLLDEGKSDVYKLKIYYVFLTFHFNLLRFVLRKPMKSLPELSVEKIKEQILTFKAVKLLNNLHEKLKALEYLSDLELQYFEGSKRYLKHYCDKYSECMTDLIPQNILDSVTRDIKYRCQRCDEDIIVLRCKHNHLNMFCSITFTPIEEDNYLVCKACGTAAWYHLHTQKPSCPLCDKYFFSNSVLPP